MVLAVVLMIIESIAFRTTAYVVQDPRKVDILHGRADDNQTISLALLSAIIWYGSARLMQQSRNRQKAYTFLGHVSMAITIALIVTAVRLEGDVRRLLEMQTISQQYPNAIVLSVLLFTSSIVGFAFARYTTRTA